MKKTKILVTTLALTLCGTIPAYAALPYNQEGGLIVMGDRAYSIYYLSNLNSATDMRSINDRVSQNTNAMYYVYSDNANKEVIVSTANINGNQYTGEGILNNTNPITYEGINGEQSYIYDTTSGEYDLQTLTGNAYISVQNMNSVNMLNVIIYATDLKGLTGDAPVYYKLDDSSTIAPLGTSINCLISNKTQEKVYILSADQTTIATGMLDTTNTYGSSYSRPFVLNPVTDSDVSNTVGNINNNGLAAYDGLWIYYSNTADGGKLYKVKADGMDNQPLSNDKVCYLNVIGDEIYYSNLSDGGKIYRVNTDGTGRTKVCDDMASYLEVSGSYIYYSNHSKGGSLSKVDIQQQGGSGQVLTDDDAAYINVVGSTIYYSNNSDGKKIYSVNTDGLSKVALSTDGATYLNVSGGYIYYGDYSDGGRVYKMKTDGSSNVKLGSHRANAINMAGNTIYYSNYDDGNKIYKINTDGSNETGPIVKNSVEFINIIANSIYFTSATKLSIATPLDGSSAVTVTAVTKPALPDKVSQLSNLTDNVASDSAVTTYPFPDKVPAIMNNNVTKEIVVNWDKTKYVKKGSTYTYTGTLLGYGNKVTLSLTVTASTPVNASNVTVVNNAGDNDTVTVTGLTAGTIVKIYSDQNAVTPLATSTVASGATAVTSNLTLNPSGGSVWITLTTPQTSTSQTMPTESARVEVQYPGETQADIQVDATNNSGPMDKVTVTGDLVSGDVVKVYKNQNDTTPIGTGTVVTAGTIDIDNLDFGAAGGTIWVSVTSSGKSESERVSGNYDASPNLGDVDAAKTTLLGDATVANSFAQALQNASDTVTSVKNDITLPVSIGSVAVSWTSNDSTITVVGSKAVVHRPTANTSVTLTATLSEGDASETATMSAVTVPPIGNQEAADLDESLISIGYSVGDSQNSVTKSLTLPIKGQNGSDITWSSSDNSTVSIDVDSSGNQKGSATVTQPPHGSTAKTVTLTATVANNGATAAKQYTITVTVLPQSSSQEDLNFALQQIPSSITVNDNDDASVEANVSSLSSGISYSWASSNPTLLQIVLDQYGNQTGSVTVHSPSYTVGAQTVNLTITLTAGTQTASKTIAVTVNSKAATDSEFVTAVGNAMSEYMVLVGNTAVPAKIYLPTSSFAASSKIDDVDISGVALKASTTVLGGVASDGTNAASISWTSSDPTAIYVVKQNDTTYPSDYGLGIIGSHTANETVTLTATITRGSYTYKKVILVKLP